MSTGEFLIILCISVHSCIIIDKLNKIIEKLKP